MQSRKMRKAIEFETERAREVYEELMGLVDSVCTAAADHTDGGAAVMAEFTKATIQAVDVALKLDVQLMAMDRVAKMTDGAHGVMDKMLKELQDAD